MPVTDKTQCPLTSIAYSSCFLRLVVPTGGLWKGKLMGQCFIVYFDSAESVTIRGSTVCGHESSANVAVLSGQRLPASNRL